VRYMAMAHMRLLSGNKRMLILLDAITQKENPWLRARGLWETTNLKRELLITGDYPDGGRQDATKMYVTSLLSSPYLSKASEGPLEEQEAILRVRIAKELFQTTIANLEAASRTNRQDILQIRQALLTTKSDALLREVLLSLRDEKPELARFLILELCKKYNGKDRFYLEAIGIAVGHHDKERRDVILKDFDKEFPVLDDKVLDLVWELRPPAMMATLGKHLQDAKLTAAQRARIIDILATSDDKEGGKALLQVLQSDVPPEVRDKVLENLKLYLPNKWRDLRASKELASTIKDLLASDEGRVKGLALIGAAEKVEMLKEVADYARNPKETLPVRKTAIATLGLLPSNDAPKALEGLLTTEPAALRTDVLQALGKLADQPNLNAPGVGGALSVLQKVAGDKKNDADLRIEAVSALAGTRQGTEWLLALAGKGGLDDVIKADAVRMLRNSAHVDLRNKALVLFPPIKIDPKKLPEIPVLAKRRGDAARGKQVFAASVKSDLQCMKCHTVRGQGGQIGPDLSMIGKKASRENLFESILYPSKAIADQYVTWIIDTKQGKSVTGLLVEETKDYVILRDANGKDTKVEVGQIDERKKSLKSLMPEDLLAHMTEDELLDLVEYLFALKTPALAIDAWQIVGPFDLGDNDAGLEKAFAPEKGVDLKAVYDGKSGKVAWKTVKPDAQGYVDLQAFYAPQSNNIVSYVYRRIESPVDQEATILLGADDGCKLWLNGTLVHSNPAHRPAVPEEDKVRVKLKKGENTILFKIANGDGAHGFYFTVVAEQELKRVMEK
jgi:putative heme-binding domain-containing protein